MKQITFMLGSSPYSGQDVDTILGIADAALKKGHQVTIVGSGDGTYAFIKDQRVSGAPHAGNKFTGLAERGAHIDL
jgi:sulfur relay (sulfurtransferase) complex TusBCD TusD component (DsrE family)